MNNKSPQPCSVERVHRSVIERRLLTALEDGDAVALLLSEQDLKDVILALDGAVWDAGMPSLPLAILASHPPGSATELFTL